jgi:hypothetical protein
MFFTLTCDMVHNLQTVMRASASLVGGAIRCVVRTTRGV